MAPSSDLLWQPDASQVVLGVELYTLLCVNFGTGLLLRRLLEFYTSLLGRFPQFPTRSSSMAKPCSIQWTSSTTKLNDGTISGAPNQPRFPTSWI
eukprot:5505595-Pyramimonas_sp.AAC.1